ncbi:MAG: radical SAM protein [Bacteroidetes bacterium]|nr:radical SAM protein [Bacteroidota bacterium]MBK8659118.1 radical SAM protein [Bacteroidota bacterium]
MSLQLPYDNAAGPFSGDKILWHAKAMEELRDGKIPAPVSIEFDLTNDCNLNCPYCTNEDYRLSCNQSLEHDIAADTIKQLASMGTKSITFTGGGDPTMHPHLAEMLQLAKKSSLDVALITNGLRQFSAEFIVENCTWVRFSVDAYDKDSYIRSKQVDGFTKVCRNIERTVESKRKLNSNCTIGIGILTETVGSGNLAKTAELFSRLGVDYIQFRPVTFLTDDTRIQKHVIEWDEADYQRAKEFETETYRVFISAAKYRNMNTDSAKRNYKHCTGVYFSCVIGATGDVWICCHMRGNKKFSIGNIKERTFQEIWNDTETRNKVYNSIGNFSECMPLCRFHGQNTLLANINWHPQHVNFL